MTRLSEAMERAALGTAGGKPESLGVAVAADPSRVDDAPKAWRFDIDERPAGLPPAPASAPVLPQEALESARGFDYKFGPRTIDKVVVGPEADDGLVEQYRRLAAVLHQAQIHSNVRSVMIASAVASEGKTLTATNIALTLTQSFHRRVLLIDADFRQPSVHEVFQLSNRVGLRDVLLQPDGGKLPVQRISSMLWVLTAGRPNSDPMSALVSDAMKQLLADAADQFDWVIIDTPPVALMPDANLLAEMIDSALVVVSAGTTPYPLVKRAVDAVGEGRILGVVLNRADDSEGAAEYGYYGYGYSRASRAAKPRRRFGIFRRNGD